MNKRVSNGMDCLPSLGLVGDEVSMKYNFGISVYLWDLNDGPKQNKSVCFPNIVPSEITQSIIEVN